MRIDPVAGVALTPEINAADPRPAQPGAAADASTASAQPPISAPREVNLAVEDDHKIVYRFVDKETGKLIEQVPPEELLRVMRNIAEFQAENARKLDQRS